MGRCPGGLNEERPQCLTQPSTHNPPYNERVEGLLGKGDRTGGDGDYEVGGVGLVVGDDEANLDFRDKVPRGLEHGLAGDCRGLWRLVCLVDVDADHRARDEAAVVDLDDVVSIAIRDVFIIMMDEVLDLHDEHALLLAAEHGHVPEVGHLPGA